MFGISKESSVTDPDPELTGGGGVVFLALPAFIPSDIPCFSTQNNGAGPLAAGLPGPLP